MTNLSSLVDRLKPADPAAEPSRNHHQQKAQNPQVSAGHAGELPPAEESKPSSTLVQERPNSPRQASLRTPDEKGRRFHDHTTPNSKGQPVESEFLSRIFARLRTAKPDEIAAVEAILFPPQAALSRPLCQDPEFIRFVKDNLWETRRERGIPWRKDVFEFVTETYGGGGDNSQTDWIRERGMSQLDIREGGDRGLYMQLARQITLKGRPKGFVLPTASEATLNTISDPKKQERVRRQRESVRASMARRRAHS